MGPSRLQTTFWLDVALLILVCALETVPFTGLVLHEWLGLATAGIVVAHLLLSWAWIAAFWSRAPGWRKGQSKRTLVNFVLNLCLFICMTAVIFSGILISQVAIPFLTRKAASPDPNFGWERIHDQFSDFVVIFVGLHVAINWSWALAAARKVFGGGTEAER